VNKFGGKELFLSDVALLRSLSQCISLIKTYKMKMIVSLVLVATWIQSAIAQINGVLTYQDDYNEGGLKGAVITKIYQSAQKNRIESVNTPEHNGVPDTANAKVQFPLLFDFAQLQKTTLHTDRNIAIVQPIDSLATLKMMQAMGSSATVEIVGAEKVGSYNCTHFVLTIKNPQVKNPKAGRGDIWVSNDLGNCNILYTGPYLYYLLGDYLQKKLAAAGATGVVIKWQTGPAVCILTNYQATRLPVSLFSVPSNYTTSNAPSGY
jgi:hypothetical protein